MLRGDPVANFQIKNVPSQLHEELRRRARQSGKTLRDYVLDLIRRDQLLPTAEDWLTELRTMPRIDLGSIDVADIIREGREEREGEVTTALQSNGSSKKAKKTADDDSR